MTMDKQQERLGIGQKPAPLDNIDLDVIDAQALGYGCHYGDFKADHPFTKDANEARLAKPKRKPQPHKVYEFYCRGCGAKFTTENKKRRYCTDACKKIKENTNYQAKQAEKKKEEIQHV